MKSFKSLTTVLTLIITLITTLTLGLGIAGAQGPGETPILPKGATLPSGSDTGGTYKVEVATKKDDTVSAFFIGDRDPNDPTQGNALFEYSFNTDNLTERRRIDGEWDPIDITTLAINPANPNHITIGYWNGIEKSTDGGVNWKSTPPKYGGEPQQPLDEGVNDLLFNDTGDMLFAATGRGVFYTIKDGDWEDWDRFGTGLVGPVRWLAMMHPVDDPNGPLVLTAGGYGSGIWQYVRPQKGGSWEEGGEWTWVEQPMNAGVYSVTVNFAKRGRTDPTWATVARSSEGVTYGITMNPSDVGPQKFDIPELNRPGDPNAGLWPYCGTIYADNVLVGTDNGIYWWGNWEKASAFEDNKVYDMTNVKVEGSVGSSTSKVLAATSTGLKFM